jgi:excisionase family DNA binding protein
MSSHNSGVVLYRPAEVARMLGCSEWWVKEQARNRRIPFAWIGGSYRFSDDHVTTIVRLFEVRPAPGGPPASAAIAEPRSRSTPDSTEPTHRLTARTPRRARQAIPPVAA